MKLFIIIFISAACTTSSQQVPNTVKFLEQDAKVRRQGVSYSTSVVHQNPNHPDQRAESTVKVDFNVPPIKQNRKPQSQPNLSYQSYANNVQQKRPKAKQNYGHSNIQQLQLHHRPQQQFIVEEKIPQANELHANIQTAPFNGQTQSFNVGYSVSFTGGPKPQPQPQPARAFSRNKLENAEIITGSRKDVVRKPNIEFDSNDFVTNAFIDLKKQKVSGIKPKYHKFPNHKENDAKNFIGNLAPKTQQFLSYLGDAKPIGSSNLRFRQQLQTNEGQGTQNVGSAWTNLSPSVEIYHSKELPQAHNFSPKEQVQQSRQFDHVGALGKSQGFDYTNALNGEIEKSQENNANIFHDTGANTLAQPEANQQSLFQSFPEFHVDQGNNPLIVPFADNFASLPLSVQLPQTLQITHKSEDVQSASKQVPVVQPHEGGIPSKFPVDVSLLRDPVLSSNVKNLPNDLHTISIPFDTALLQAMQQKLVTSTQPIQSFDASKGQVQVIHGNAGITGGQYFQGNENLQVQPLQGLQPNAFQHQGFQELQGQQIQQTQQYNAFEPPQHALLLKKGFDKYFDQYYDQMRPQESKRESVTVRYPKVNINNDNTISNTRLRVNKGMAIHTNLQPPPVQFARHRRMFTG